ncbi:MAG: ergothioneine biosynthesis protein EgtB [Pseudomonadota bacterium]
MPLDISPPHRPPKAERAAAAAAYRRVRDASLALARRFPIEDWMLQSMEEASPIKWNLAHTTWFFETFVLRARAPQEPVFDPAFGYLFNSYYEQIGDRHPRARRGLLSRPDAQTVVAYRAHVDERMIALLESADRDETAALAPILDLGLAHEEQHQELLITDIQHALSTNPTLPTALSGGERGLGAAPPIDWVGFDGGLVEIGWDGRGFAFDNEGPRHKAHLEPFALASRSVTNGEFAEFIDDGGYDDCRLWLADGWARRCDENWSAPLYWRREDDAAPWSAFSLFGVRAIDPAAPVAHVSFYEAAAFAEWAGARLPREAEWECASREADAHGAVLDGAALRAPQPALAAPGRVSQMFGDVWEWTASAYSPYPGFRAAAGPVGEYNGKFMSSQMVLRGGSCATPRNHVRATYRNFFPPEARWQFSGLRLARDA